MYKKYAEFTDEELIGLCRDGDGQVEAFLMVKYKNLVRKKAGTMYLIGGETEDLIQEGMIGLVKAVRDYDFGRDATFFTFAELCITRQMYTAIQNSNRKKHWPLNHYISLYSDGENERDEDGNAASLVDCLENDAKVTDPERIVLSQEAVDSIEKIIQNELTELEKQVLELHMTGMGYVEIARVLGRDEKSTDNALQRTKQKIRKCLQKNE